MLEMALPFRRIVRLAYGPLLRFFAARILRGQDLGKNGSLGSLGSLSQKWAGEVQERNLAGVDQAAVRRAEEFFLRDRDHRDVFSRI